MCTYFFFFFSSRRRHTRWNCDWSSDVCSSDLASALVIFLRPTKRGLAFVSPQIQQRFGNEGQIGRLEVKGVAGTKLGFVGDQRRIDDDTMPHQGEDGG